MIIKIDQILPHPAWSPEIAEANKPLQNETGKAIQRCYKLKNKAYNTNVQKSLHYHSGNTFFTVLGLNLHVMSSLDLKEKVILSSLDAVEKQVLFLRSQSKYFDGGSYRSSLSYESLDGSYNDGALCPVMFTAKPP